MALGHTNTPTIESSETITVLRHVPLNEVPSASFKKLPSRNETAGKPSEWLHLFLYSHAAPTQTLVTYQVQVQFQETCKMYVHHAESY